MKTLFTDMPQFEEKSPSIFLCGPTPRSKEVPSWRPEAVEILSQLQFEGTVIIPEDSKWGFRNGYVDQIEWELCGIHHCSAVVFWIPRKMDTMPALTTNTEFGYCISKYPNKMYYGRPTGAASTGYQDYLYHKFLNKTPCDNLVSLLSESVNFIKDS